MGRVAEAYLRERLHDFETLADELIGNLADKGLRRYNLSIRSAPPPVNAVLIALFMGSADLLAYDRSNLRGVALEAGSAMAHIAIVAQALEISLIGRAEGILSEVQPGDEIMVDGDNAQVFLRPTEKVREQFERCLWARITVRARFADSRDIPCVATDGTAVSLLANASLLVGMPEGEPNICRGHWRLPHRNIFHEPARISSR